MLAESIRSIAALGGGLWSVHLPYPLLHTGDWRGWWPAATQSSLAVPLDQDHAEEFAFSPLGLFVRVSSLSLSLSLSLSMMSSLPPASVEELWLPSIMSQMRQETLGSY